MNMESSLSSLSNLDFPEADFMKTTDSMTDSQFEVTCQSHLIFIGNPRHPNCHVVWCLHSDDPNLLWDKTGEGTTRMHSVFAWSLFFPTFSSPTSFFTIPTRPTMPSKLLEYESLKSVLRNMEPHLRILLALRLPAICFAEKSIPFQAHTLIFHSYGTQVHDTYYGWGIIRDYHNPNDTPPKIQKANEKGGAQVDFDEYGFEVLDSENSDGPGDVKLGNGNTKHRRDGSDDMKDRLEHIVEDFEKELAEAEKRIAQGEKVREFPKYEGPPEEFLENVVPLFVESPLPLRSLEEIRTDLEEYGASLLPFRYREMNTSPPFTYSLQLKVDSPPEKVQTYRFPYSIKLNEAIRRLNTLLLGGKAIHVKSLVISKPDMDIRLPVDLKIRIQNLIIQRDVSNSLKALEPIIDPISYPLESLSVENARLQAADYDHPVLQQANKLYIQSDRFWNDQIPLQLLKNQFVRYSVDQFSMEERIQLIRDWFEHGRDIGTRLLLDIRKEKTARALLGRVMEEFEGEKYERCYVIPMSNNRELELSYREILNPPEGSFAKWIFEMQICQTVESN